MNADEALRFVEELIRASGERPLNDLQRLVFKGAWLGKDYKEIHQDCSQVTLAHIERNVGPKLWRSLSSLVSGLLDELTEIRKDSLQGPIERLHDRLTSQDDSPEPVPLPDLPPVESSNFCFSDHINQKQDWGYAPSVPLFQGRISELQELDQWVDIDACRLVALVGTVGIGKTALSVKLAEQLRDRFEVLIWRTIDPSITGETPPLLPDLLNDWIAAISDQQNFRSDLTSFLDCIRTKRCLLVLDGFEAVFQNKELSGTYQTRHEAYGDLLKRVCDAHHSSCLLITSREKPREVESREGMAALVRSYPVFGLQLMDVQTVFETKGRFTATDADWRSLIYQYDGNPYFLQDVATLILHAFGGDISSFLAFQAGQAVFVGTIRTALETQIHSLSDSEIKIVAALARYGDAVGLEDIQQFIGTSLSRHQFLEVLLSLVRRSFLRSNSATYFLNPLIAEWMSCDFKNQ